MGKTTLSRKLIQELKEREDFKFHMILDPSFDSEYIFLTSLARNFDIDISGIESPTVIDLRDALERFLFQKGVNENRTIVLIIDEAQKLSEESLEVLRVLLNYETNKFKLLQLVLLGQLELHSKIVKIPNFVGRISYKHTLNPLCFEETRDMIEFRIRQAGYKQKTHIFLDEAIRDIHHHSGGCPRQIMLLCHKALKRLILTKKFTIDRELVQDIIDKEVQTGWHSTGLSLQKKSY